MPIYEYLCRSCDGIFEALRSLRESSEPAPCPVCDRESARIMPTSFTAFSVREGLPRRLPDRGTYWHLGKEVKQMGTGGVPAFEHPELYKAAPKKEPTAGDRADIAEMEHLKQRHAEMLQDSGERPSVDNHGVPNLSAQAGAAGHVSDQDVWDTEKAREGRRT
jgi:putative FmdB family regulatory protein